MTAIDITREEVQSGQMTGEHRAQAVQAMQEDGYVVLHDVIDLEHIALLRDKMLADLPLFIARDDAPFNWNRGNVQQDPPPFPPYLFRDVLMNDMAIAVTHALMGNGVKNAYYSGNTAVKADGKRQPVHADTGQLWPGLNPTTPPFGLVVNVPVVDMTPENGSTELWPGTHRDNTISIQDSDLKVPADVLEARRMIAPPFQPTVRAGSIILRDIRLWHAGMPNTTEQARPMIAMIHWIQWWTAHDLPKFPKSAQSFFEHPVLRTRAQFVDGDIDYIQQPGAYEYQK